MKNLKSLNTSKNHITLNNLINTLKTKYNLLKKKLLLKITNLSSNLY